jgi:hypothetical protein
MPISLLKGDERTILGGEGSILPFSITRLLSLTSLVILCSGASWAQEKSMLADVWVNSAGGMMTTSSATNTTTSIGVNAALEVGLDFQNRNVRCTVTLCSIG